MLDTLYAIGKEISRDRDDWEDIILRLKETHSQSNKQKLILNIVFDLDSDSVVVSPENLSLFSQEVDFLVQIGLFNLPGRRSKFVFVACPSEKIERISKSLFGKREDSTGEGELIESINKDAPELKGSLLYNVIKDIRLLENQFTEALWNQQKQKFDPIKLQSTLKLGTNDQLVAIYASISHEKYGLRKVPLAQVDGYLDFIKNKFLRENQPTETSPTKMCYAAGTFQGDVNDAKFADDENLNKLFVKTTRNFANNFDEGLFGRNYQISAKIESYLDRGSHFILDHLKCKIAGIRHVIIPRFFKQDYTDIQSRLDRINQEKEFLFNWNDFETINAYLYYNHADQEIYWLNFLALDSVKGQYLKVCNQIIDVPSFFFNQLIIKFEEATNLLKPWLENHALNFYSIYEVIPLRLKDKKGKTLSKNNKALALFGAVMERRRVDPNLIFLYFKELALCHWFERYESFSNIETFSNIQNNKFDYAIKNGVFRFLGFLYVLHQLDLLQNRTTMKEENENALTSSNIAEDIQAFFNKLHYSNEHQALFFLGRALSQIAYAQEKKGHNKRILEKINFNGMDSRHITRLSTELFEKAMQHDVLSDAQWNLAEFNRRFNPEHWSLNPQEATFYLLSGYTYTIKSKNN